MLSLGWNCSGTTGMISRVFDCVVVGRNDGGLNRALKKSSPALNLLGSFSSHHQFNQQIYHLG